MNGKGGIVMLGDGDSPEQTGLGRNRMTAGRGHAAARGFRGGGGGGGGPGRSGAFNSHGAAVQARGGHRGGGARGGMGAGGRGAVNMHYGGGIGGYRHVDMDGMGAMGVMGGVGGAMQPMAGGMGMFYGGHPGRGIPGFKGGAPRGGGHVHRGTARHGAGAAGGPVSGGFKGNAVSHVASGDGTGGAPASRKVAVRAGASHGQQDEGSGAARNREQGAKSEAGAGCVALVEDQHADDDDSSSDGGNVGQTELDKRRDKRRRYRRRKRDRDLQEELLVRQQHVLAVSPSSAAVTPPTTITNPPAAAAEKSPAVDGSSQPSADTDTAQVSSVGDGKTVDREQPEAATAPATAPALSGPASSSVAPPLAQHVAPGALSKVDLGDSAGATALSDAADGAEDANESVFEGGGLPGLGSITSSGLPGGVQLPEPADAKASHNLQNPMLLPYGHGQGQGVGHNPAREDSSLWHYCPEHYDVSRPLYVRVCGLKAAIHIDQRGIIWLNLSQLMKLVGKTKKQTLDLYGDDAFDTSKRTDVKMLDLKDGPKASAYVSELRARQLVIPFMGPTKSTNFLAELDRIHREFKVPVLEAYDTAEPETTSDGGPEHTPLYLRFRNWGGGEGGEEGKTEDDVPPDLTQLELMKAEDNAQSDMGDIMGDIMRAQPGAGSVGGAVLEAGHEEMSGLTRSLTAVTASPAVKGEEAPGAADSDTESSVPGNS